MFVPKKKWCVAIVACAVTMFAATAWAQQQRRKSPPPRQPDPEAAARRAKAFWKNADANKDGVVDLKEYLAFHKKEFARLDTNGDGKLTPKEFAAPRREGSRTKRPAEGRAGQGIQKIFANADANGDGKLSRDEAPAQIGNRFDMIDSDGDGFITLQEIQQVMRGRRGGGGRR
jgi:hypothetical protein